MGPNREIVEHHKKRKIEVHLAQDREYLQEQSLDDEEVTAKVALRREKLTSKSAVSPLCISKNTAKETHAIAKRKSEQLERLAVAFGIQSSHEGEAFNREHRKLMRFQFQHKMCLQEVEEIGQLRSQKRALKNIL